LEKLKLAELSSAWIRFLFCFWIASVVCTCRHKTRQRIGKLAKETAAKLKTTSNHAQNDSSSVSAFFHTQQLWAEAPWPWMNSFCNYSNRNVMVTPSCIDLRWALGFWVSARAESHWCKACKGFPGSSCWVPKCSENCARTGEILCSICASGSSTW